MLITRRFFSIVTLLLTSVYPAVAPPVASGQTDPAPCGYVDGFDFPVPDIDIERTDFGLYRAQFGGLHTGIDVAFDQLGSPVHAAARGIVTYSNTEGWDTEKGVVVIQHTFPDGTQVNTLYGHMQELNNYTFPPMNHCVEKGDIIGAIGAPTLSRPHLHYEIRTRYRHEGGPGYTDVNPLELGWLHPVDYTLLARLRIHPAYRQHFSLLESMTLPPLPLSSGGYVVTHSSRLAGLTSDGQVLWQFDTLGSVTGLLELPDGRILATTSSDQALVLANGSYNALWIIPKSPILPPILFGGSVVFATNEGTLLACTPEGVPVWETAPLSGRVARWANSADRLAVTTTASSALWIIDQAGSVLYQTDLSETAAPFAADDGGILVLTGNKVMTITHDLTALPLFETQNQFTVDAELQRDDQGNLYIYPGEGRALYAYQADGALKWVGYMPGSHLRPPRLGIGAGSLIYALSTDGQLLAYDTRDGRLTAQLALYNGGIDGSPSARWLAVEQDDSVQFASGFLSVVTINGLDLLPEE